MKMEVRTFRLGMEGRSGYTVQVKQNKGQKSKPEGKTAGVREQGIGISAFKNPKE